MEYKYCMKKHSHERFLARISIALAISTVAFMWLAVRDSKPLNCDDITYDKWHDAHVCEITIK